MNFSGGIYIVFNPETFGSGNLSLSLYKHACNRVLSISSAQINFFDCNKLLIWFNDSCSIFNYVINEIIPANFGFTVIS